MSSSPNVEELSSSIQQAPNQTGTIIIDHQGNVLASSGDVKETSDRLSAYLITLLQDTNGLFVHSQQAGKGKEELSRIIVSFKTYQYAISMTPDLIVCVKSNID